MLPARFEQATICLVVIDNSKLMRPAVCLGGSAGSFAEQQLVMESTWIEVKPRFRDPDEKTCPFPLNRAVPSEEVTDTKNMWTFLRTNFCDPWMEVPLNRGFPNLNESFHCIWMSTNSLYMRNIKTLNYNFTGFQASEGIIAFTMITPGAWTPVKLTNALQSNELSALRNTFYLEPRYKI